ncbi:hypothetical protein BN1708_002336 [Verticillium longisporum]|uniref:Uncharacterized protein n=1 Tax=Verticillium longisporum TaxID=100787 RepID=A0A0G4KQC5_VERLO|nr:hypothetical protein BN1708_002336 [Verticillium longisporum]
MHRRGRELQLTRSMDATRLGHHDVGCSRGPPANLESIQSEWTKKTGPTRSENEELTPIASTAYWIAFGPHGPRAADPAGEGSRVFFGTLAAVGASLAIFGVIRLFAKPPPPTMTKEWQEASNEVLKNQKADPLTGISSEGYAGVGQVQSPPKH